MTKKGVNVNELPTFNSVEDRSLRSHNRGAILANIYEIYKKSYDDVLHCWERYLDRIPEHERGNAQSCMLVHLKERGYTIGR